MKATGVMRRVDDLGRIVLPKELRKVYGLDPGTPMEIFVSDDGTIVLRKYTPGCLLCGQMENLLRHPNGKHICKECVDKLE